MAAFFQKFCHVAARCHGRCARRMLDGWYTYVFCRYIMTNYVYTLHDSSLYNMYCIYIYYRRERGRERETMLISIEIDACFGCKKVITIENTGLLTKNKNKCCHRKVTHILPAMLRWSPFEYRKIEQEPTLVIDADVPVFATVFIHLYVVYSVPFFCHVADRHDVGSGIRFSYADVRCYDTTVMW